MIAAGVLRCMPEEVADICANFEPGAVALLDHHHGRPVGWLQAVLADGADILFTTTIEDADMADRLRRGPVPISLEMSGRGVRIRSDEPGIPLPFDIDTTYRGQRGRPGWTLRAVAVLRDGDRPGAVGSALWAADR